MDPAAVAPPRRPGLAPLKRPDGRSPLAADITREDYAEQARRCKEAKAQRKKKGKGASNCTESQYAMAFNKWFKAFCEYADWNLEDAMRWVDEEGNIIADGTFRQFFLFLYKHPGITKAIFKNALYWAESELNHQLTSRGVRETSEYIVNMTGVKNLKDEVYSSARTRKLESMVDMHADIDGELTD